MLKILLLLLIFLFTKRALFFTRERTLSFAGETRRYRIHVPRGIDKTQPVPFVVMLHGFGDHPRLMEAYTAMSTKADQEKFIVVYPYGSKSTERPRLSWNGAFCCGEGWRSDHDDVEFLHLLINELRKEYPIDPEKISMAGFSNGAILTYRFIAKYPDLLHAVAIVSGSMGGKVTLEDPFITLPAIPEHPPILLIHGQKDTVIPYEGGKNEKGDAEFLSVHDSIKLLLTGEELQETQTTALGSESTYTKGDRRILKLVTLTEGKHIWSGGLATILDTVRFKKTYPTTNAVWDFFSKN